MNLLDYPWHDAILKEIRIDRSNPGNNDVITMVVIWQNGSESIFHFKDVYHARLELNFGVIADECISDVSFIPSSNSEVVSFIEKWKKLIPDIDKILFVGITTITTASTMLIFAKEVFEDKHDGNVVNSPDV